MFFFSRYFPIAMTNLENVRITFSSTSCSLYLTASSLANDNNKYLQLTYKPLYAKRDHCLQIITDQNISFGFSRFMIIL